MLSRWINLDIHTRLGSRPSWRREMRLSLAQIQLGANNAATDGPCGTSQSQYQAGTHQELRALLEQLDRCFRVIVFFDAATGL